MNDEHDNAQTDKEALAKAEGSLARRSLRAAEVDHYLLVSGEQSFTGSAEHIYGIASYIQVKEREHFQVFEVRHKAINLRTLRKRI